MVVVKCNATISRRRQRVAGGLKTEDRLATGCAHRAVRAEGRRLGHVHLRGQQQTRTFGQKGHHGGRDR